MLNNRAARGWSTFQPAEVVRFSTGVDTVWDHLHGFSEPTPLADVDLVFFDSTDMSVDRERQVEEAPTGRLRGLPWEARNQAAVHLWFPRKFGYEVEPFSSTAEAIASWPETATSVSDCQGTARGERYRRASRGTSELALGPRSTAGHWSGRLGFCSQRRLSSRPRALVPVAPSGHDFRLPRMRLPLALHLERRRAEAGLSA